MRPLLTRNIYFNPHSRTGSDSIIRRFGCGVNLFQSTLPHGERREVKENLVSDDKFQSTLPHGERLAKVAYSVVHTIFQSTLPHGERPAGLLLLLMSAMYFNPRSRTGSDPFVSCYLCPPRISIHAPARGATVPLSGHRYFPPISIHAPARGATYILPAFAVVVLISIHAPARGATAYRYALWVFHSNFNPRSRTGSDQTQQGFNQATIAFQSTLPHGERPLASSFSSCSIPFQSTLPHGERPDTAGIQPGYDCISIHAPARGAT